MDEHYEESDAFSPAGLAERIVAFYVDAKLALTGMSVLAVGAVQFLGMPSPLGGFLIPVGFITYHALLNSGRRQSAGKWLVGIRVIGANGNPLTPLRAFLRAFAYLLSCLPLGAGFLWPAFNPRAYALHDLAVGSRVVETRPKNKAAQWTIAILAALIVLAHAALLFSYFHRLGLEHAAKPKRSSVLMRR